MTPRDLAEEQLRKTEEAAAKSVYGYRLQEVNHPIYGGYFVHSELIGGGYSLIRHTGKVDDSDRDGVLSLIISSKPVKASE